MLGNNPHYLFVIPIHNISKITMEYTCVNSVYPEMKIKQKGDIVNYYSKNHNGHLIKLECNIETHEMRTFKKIPNTNKFVAFPHNKIDDNDRIEIYGEGDRWEGDSFNGIPFGYGHFYDDEGNRMYSGFLYKGKKVGYGTEYFADTHTIDYCGHFMNDKRHGWGISYDRNGTKLYEGEWRFGFNHYSKYTVTRENENMNIFSSDIQELVIEDYCFDSKKIGKSFCIENNSLLTLHINNCCFCNVSSFEINNCNHLEIVRIGEYCFGEILMNGCDGLCYIHNCSNLRVLSILSKSFCFYNMMKLESSI